MSDELRKAAQAVIDRWDSTRWEWIKQGPTADVINELRRQLEKDDWQPIEAAPDGVEVLLVIDDTHITIGSRWPGLGWSWRDFIGTSPSHWRALPPPPEVQNGGINAPNKNY